MGINSGFKGLMWYVIVKQNVLRNPLFCGGWREGAETYVYSLFQVIPVVFNNQ